MRLQDHPNNLTARILAAGAVLLISVPPATGEFRLPACECVQSQPAVAADARGGVVIVRREQFPEAAQPLDTIRMQRFDPTGNAAGENLRVDLLPGDNARSPAVDVAADGSAVVVWEGGAAEGRFRRTIWARRFAPDGRPRGAEIKVNSDRLQPSDPAIREWRHGGPAVSIAPDGGFIVVWQDNGARRCNGSNIAMRRFDAEGKPTGPATRVNTDPKLGHVHPAIDHDARGNALIVWQRTALLDTASERGVIVGRRIGARTGTAGEPFTISDGLGHSSAPSAASAADDSFVVAWLERPPDAERALVLARRITGDGRQGPPGEVASTSLGLASRPVVVAAPGHPPTVVWSGGSDDPWVGAVISARTLESADDAPGPVITVGPATCRDRELPAAAALPGGDVVAVWQVSDKAAIEGARVRPTGRGVAVQSLAPTIAETWPTLLPTEDLHRDADERCQAARDLGCFRYEASSAAAVLRTAATADPSPCVRGAAVTSLALVARDPRSVLPTLSIALRDESWVPREGALRGFGVLGLADAAAMLMQTLEIGSPDMVRAAAASSLADIARRPETGPTIAEGIRDALLEATETEERPVRLAAFAALVRIPRPPHDLAKTIFNSLFESDPTFALALIGAMGPDGQPAAYEIGESMDDLDPALRRQAVNCLVKIESGGLGRLLADPDPYVRTAAAGGLRAQGQRALAAWATSLEKAVRIESDDAAAIAMDGAWDAHAEAGCAEEWIAALDDAAKIGHATSAVSSTPTPISPSQLVQVVASRDGRLAVAPYSDHARWMAAAPDAAGNRSPIVYQQVFGDPSAAAARRAELAALTEDELVALVSAARPGWRGELEVAPRVVSPAQPEPGKAGYTLTSVYVVTTRSLDLTTGKTESLKWFFENVESAQNLYGPAVRPFWRVVYLKNFQDPAAAEAHLAELEALTPEQLSQFVRRDNPQYEDVIQRGPRPGVPAAMQPPSEDP